MSFHHVTLRPRTLLAAACAIALSLTLLPPAALADEADEAELTTELIRLEGDDGTVFEVPGYGRFSGAIEVRPAPDGRLILINELPMDAYIDGLAEVPASWPLETLKAQAVAARTYAWSSVLRRTFHDRGFAFDICATVQCQVFHGTEIIESPHGDRWQRAVEETAGEVLVWDDAPILARYFSSSGGHTRNNEHVFGASAPEGPRPYLVGVEDPHEDISPHHRWSIRMTRDELNELFSHGVNLRHAVPVAGVERVISDGTQVDQVRAIGEDGTVVEVSASKFRSWISEVGADILPNRFPGETTDGDPLPEGLPSSRLEFELRDDDTFIIEGRGWGHGVGMSQWGARGKAEAGFGHAEILAAYYNGLLPERHPEVPDEVRVGLTWEAEDLQIEAEGGYTAVAGEHQAVRSGGTWQVEARDSNGITATPPSVDWEERPTPPAEEDEVEATEPADDLAAEDAPIAARGQLAQDEDDDAPGIVGRIGSFLRSGGLLGYLRDS